MEESDVFKIKDGDDDDDDEHGFQNSKSLKGSDGLFIELVCNYLTP